MVGDLTERKQNGLSSVSKQPFRLLDFDYSPSSNPYQPLRLHSRKALEAHHPFLGALVAELVQRYRPLANRIRQEIKGEEPSEKPTSPTEKSSSKSNEGIGKSQVPLSSTETNQEGPLTDVSAKLPTQEVDHDPLMVRGHNRMIRIEVSEEQYAKYFSEKKRRERAQHSAEVIDAFLSSDFTRPDPIPQPAEDLHAVPHPDALASVEEPEDAVTETMAKLLIMQNRIDEAVQVYRRLQLLFPEKSAFFAGQIEKINQG